jgi:Tfp pilus assembly protein PilO
MSCINLVVLCILAVWAIVVIVGTVFYIRDLQHRRDDREKRK